MKNETILSMQDLSLTDVIFALFTDPNNKIGVATDNYIRRKTDYPFYYTYVKKLLDKKVISKVISEDINLNKINILKLTEKGIKVKKLLIKHKCFPYFKIYNHEKTKKEIIDLRITEKCLQEEDLEKLLTINKKEGTFKGNVGNRYEILTKIGSGITKKVLEVKLGNRNMTRQLKYLEENSFLRKEEITEKYVLADKGLDILPIYMEVSENFSSKDEIIGTKENSANINNFRQINVNSKRKGILYYFVDIVENPWKEVVLNKVFMNIPKNLMEIYLIFKPDLPIKLNSFYKNSLGRKLLKKFIKHDLVVVKNDAVHFTKKHKEIFEELEKEGHLKNFNSLPIQKYSKYITNLVKKGKISLDSVDISNGMRIDLIQHDISKLEYLLRLNNKTSGFELTEEQASFNERIFKSNGFEIDGKLTEKGKFLYEVIQEVSDGKISSIKPEIIEDKGKDTNKQSNSSLSINENNKKKVEIFTTFEREDKGRVRKDIPFALTNAEKKTRFNQLNQNKRTD